ncbi:unnamed protein product [Trichobilharzia szidati]|nr:unnamed protein product [Trichobilharzia szidati]
MSVCAGDNADNAKFMHNTALLKGLSDKDEAATPVIKVTGDLPAEEANEIADKLIKTIKEEFDKDNAKLSEAIQQTVSELIEEQEKSTNSASYYGSDLVLQGISVVIVTLTCFSVCVTGEDAHSKGRSENVAKTPHTSDSAAKGAQLIAEQIKRLEEEEVAKENQRINDALREIMRKLKEEKEELENSASHYGSHFVLHGICVVIVTLTCVYGIF